MKMYPGLKYNINISRKKLQLLETDWRILYISRSVSESNNLVDKDKVYLVEWKKHMDDTFFVVFITSDIVQRCMAA